jgi:hypothetical protein
MPQADLQKSGISCATDLIKFPWDDDTGDIISDEEVEDLTNLIAEANKRSAK